MKVDAAASQSRDEEDDHGGDENDDEPHFHVIPPLRILQIPRCFLELYSCILHPIRFVH